MAHYAQSGSMASADVRVDLAAFALLFGRVCFAADFLLFGARKFADPSIIHKLIESFHLPGELVYPAMTLQLVGGFCILIGLQTRIVAALFAWFCIVAPSIFWFNHLEHLSRDYAAAGGFLLLLLFGAGPLSVDARFRLRDWVVMLVPAVIRNGTLIERVMLVARVLIAFPFLADVVKKILYFAPQRAFYEQAGLPGEAMVAVMAIELVFGLAVLVGYRTRFAAIVLLVMTACLAVKLRNPAYDVAIFEPGVMTRNFFNRNAATFFKDVTTIGALLILWACGPGRLSLRPQRAPPG